VTCAKRTVTCIIRAPDGRQWFGSNECARPQKTCPRLPGEGYAKCATICQQGGHAEQVAAARAGDQARGGVAYVYGHNFVCGSCGDVLEAAGLKSVVIVLGRAAQWNGPPPARNVQAKEAEER